MAWIEVLTLISKRGLDMRVIMKLRSPGRRRNQPDGRESGERPVLLEFRPTFPMNSRFIPRGIQAIRH